MYLALVILSLTVALLAFLLYRQQMRWNEAHRQQSMRLLFLSNISKQIRQPLNQLAKISDVVGNEHLYISKDEKRDMAETIGRYSEMVGRLLDELAIFVDPTQQSYALCVQNFNPAQLCRRRVAMCEPREGLRIMYNRQMGENEFVRTDPHLVEMILGKLLLLSVRFTRQGTVTVSCSTTENLGCLTIAVQDTGQGIPQDRRNKLFDWFERPDDMHDEAELDLSISQRLVQRLGGRLIHDTSVQNGTRMVVVIPIK